MNKYVAGTSDMFRQFIDRGLECLDAAGGLAALPPPAAGGTAGTPVPRLARLSPGRGAERASPGSARSDASQSRLTLLRERMVRASAEGAPGGAAAAATGVPPTPGSARGPRVTPRGEAGGVAMPPPPARGPSIEELTARMQALRRPQN